MAVEADSAFPSKMRGKERTMQLKNLQILDTEILVRAFGLIRREVVEKGLATEMRGE